MEGKLLCIANDLPTSEVGCGVFQIQADRPEVWSDAERLVRHCLTFSLPVARHGDHNWGAETAHIDGHEPLSYRDSEDESSSSEIALGCNRLHNQKEPS